jgi:hypothetical protein
VCTSPGFHNGKTETRKSKAKQTQKERKKIELGAEINEIESRKTMKPKTASSDQNQEMD